MSYCIRQNSGAFYRVQRKIFGEEVLAGNYSRGPAWGADTGDHYRSWSIRDRQCRDRERLEWFKCNGLARISRRMPCFDSLEAFQGNESKVLPGRGERGARSGRWGLCEEVHDFAIQGGEGCMRGLSFRCKFLSKQGELLLVSRGDPFEVEVKALKELSGSRPGRSLHPWRGIARSPFRPSSWRAQSNRLSSLGGTPQANQ